MLTPEQTAAQIEVLARILGGPPGSQRPEPRPKSDAELAAEDYWEGIAEDRAHEARWGHVSESEARVRQERVDNWLEREAS